MFTQPFADIAPWPPTLYTRPLSDDFPSAFDPYAPLMQAAWEQSFGYPLEAWQIALLRAVLELYPEGHARAGQLRWMQVVVSLGRQNGKSEIAAALGLWQLIANPRGALIAGLATSVKQAGIVYDRARTVITRTSLSKSFKATGTRGITSKLPGAKYTMEPAKSAALQGIPITLGIVDELHILKSALWTDMVNGAGGRPNCLVVGITTAGDDDSDLLKHLYEQGMASIGEDGERRVGFFAWQAPDSEIPADDEMLGRYLAMASPGVASGRRDLENLVTKVRTLPKPEVVRYDFNRFIASVNTFIPVEKWATGTTGDPFPAGQPVFAFARTSDWGYATISAAVKMPDGKTYCDLVSSITKPTISQLADLAVRLSRHNPATFAMGSHLRDLAKELEMRGLPTYMMTSGDFLNGSALFYAKATQGLLQHPGHALLSLQIPRTIRKNVGENFRISWEESSVEIDAVISHLIGVHVAETQREMGLQIF